MCGGGCRTVFKEAYSRIRKQALKERKRAVFCFFVFLAVQRQTSFLGTKGGRKAGSQAVPLLHLTAVQNDS